jgi:pimeloyl-ACP methyl ester carboxylesterase
MSKLHLILIPGLICDDTLWEHQAHELRNLAEISIADHGSLDSFAAMADAILKTAPPHFAMAGHSMGGRVAFQIFKRAADRISGIALMDTAPTPRAPGVEGQREAEQRFRLLDKAHKEGMRAMGTEWLKPMVHPDRLSDAELMNAILDMIERKTPDIFAAQINALLHRPDSRSILPEIRCPTLVLCGRQDAWSGLAYHEEMASMIPSSSLAVIENCGHMSPMERPAEVTAAMRGWLEAIGKMAS